MQRTVPHSPRRILAALLATGLCAAALAGHTGDAEPASASAFELLTVRCPTGPAFFHVEDPEAQSSAAWRNDGGHAYKTGATPEPVAGFELTNRIVVRTDDPASLYAYAITDPAVTIEPLADVPGFWTVGTHSVRTAIELSDDLATSDQYAEVYLDMTAPRDLRDVPTDPFFYQQWHLKNDQDPLFDVNAEAAWDAGYTGAGVVIGIVENAWQHDHPDLADNFHAEASQTGGTLSGHATSCAGVAGEVGYNDLMGAGMAYEAWLSNQIYGSDSQTAAALAFRNDLNDIKSNSWGPSDTGTIAYLPSVVRTAIEESIDNGRGGLGEIFVWAAGNGGAANDRVDYDPYASSRYTIAIGAIGDADIRADYNEKGSSMVVVAHSSGNTRKVPSTGMNSSWTQYFGGTSAASPLAAGVIALMLEANPDLTWRDVQHVLIESARKNNPDHPCWATNGAGYDVNINYGFGAIDAGAAVVLAKNWTNVPHEVDADTGVITVNTPIPDNDPNGLVLTTTVTDDIRVETVELILNVDTPFVGDLEIALFSPSGLRSLFTKQRSGDYQDDLNDYVFTSFRHWGESSTGDWQVMIADPASGDLATWIDYRLVVHGTPICPGDLDGDGVIALGDLAALLAAYGTCEDDAGFEPAADFDNSRCIELSDLAYLLSKYGESCP